MDGRIISSIEHFSGSAGIANKLAEYRVDGSGKWKGFVLLDQSNNASIVMLSEGEHPIIAAMMNGSSYIEVREKGETDRFSRSTFSLRGSTRALSEFKERCGDNQPFKSAVALAQEMIGEKVYSKRTGRFETDDDAWGDASITYDEELEIIGVNGEFKDSYGDWSVALEVKKTDGVVGYMDYNSRHYSSSKIAERGWPSEINNAISKGTLLKGMTMEQVLASWGKPVEKNDSFVSSVASSQWVYYGHYIYFDDNKLVAWQTR